MVKFGMVIDLDKCTACQSCTVACKAENNISFQKPEESVNRGMFWNDVLTTTEGVYPSAKMKFLPRPCMHCERPPCVQVCPVGASFKNQDGVVLVNYERCIGCRYCLIACPYNLRYFNWKVPEFPGTMKSYVNPLVPVRPRGVAEKCTFCIQRITAGKSTARKEKRELRDGDIVPACVQTCTGKARTFGDLDNPDSKVSKLIKSNRAFVLLEEKGTHPQVYYLTEG